MRRKGGSFQSIKEILESQLAKGGQRSPLGVLDLVQCWPEIVGSAIAEQSCPSRLKNGTLTIHVRSPVWANELQLMTEVLLQKISNHSPQLGIKGLRFYCE